MKDLSAGQIITNYKEIWKIEDAFGEIKGTIKALPIFHWTDHRIIGHLTACFIAHYCETQVTKLLRDKNLLLKSESIKNKVVKNRPLTFVKSLKELNEVRAVPVKVEVKQSGIVQIYQAMPPRSSKPLAPKYHQKL